MYILAWTLCILFIALLAWDQWCSSQTGVLHLFCEEPIAPGLTCRFCCVGCGVGSPDMAAYQAQDSTHQVTSQRPQAYPESGAALPQGHPNSYNAPQQQVAMGYPAGKTAS